MGDKSTVGTVGSHSPGQKECQFQAMAETETGAGWRISGEVKPQRLH